MFAKSIINSDAFLEMPISAQCLYFHLGMRADDDGVVNNPKSIMRLIGAKNDDMRLLIVKKFVIEMEDSLIVIKHWKINNYIQNDRYTPSKYQEVIQQLELDKNKAYKLPCIHDVYTGKDRLDKDRLDKISNNKKEEKKKIEKEKRNSDVFALVENYFKRPLSQMECNVIDSWIDNYSYSDIQNAITLTKSSNNNNYKSIRYIDTVLLNNFSKDKEKENDKENNESELDDVIDLSQIDWLKN